MNTLKIVNIGNSLGIILPKEILSKLRIKKGDSVYATETPEGVELSPYNKEFAQQMELAETIMRENRNVLKKLAK